jgi:hypothetical protein
MRIALSHEWGMEPPSGVHAMKTCSRDVVSTVVGVTFVLVIAACQKAGDSGATSGSAGPSAASGLLGSPASGVMSSPASGLMSKGNESGK